MTPPPRSRQRVFFGDQAGIAAVLAAAHKLMVDGAATACLVGGVDSLAASHWAESCQKLAILKTPVRPVGLIPGEAGAFLIVEPARRRGGTRKTLGSISKCEFGQEAGHRFSDPQPVGHVMADLIQRCLAGSGGLPGLISDINGDPARSAELGMTLVRLRPDIEFAATIVPGTTFGDTRAASAFLGLCMALRAFQRGYAPGPSFLISAGSDNGGRTALHVGA
jgi:3-oxoacyl-[acyl-carrier-protein] synthase-1